MITFIMILILLLFSGIIFKGLIKILQTFAIASIVFFLVVAVGATIGVITDKADHLANSANTVIQEEEEKLNSDVNINELQKLSQMFDGVFKE